MMDEIKISLCADDEIKAAVEGAKEFIMDETIAKSLGYAEGLPEFDINGHKTGIAVERL